MLTQIMCSGVRLWFFQCVSNNVRSYKYYVANVYDMAKETNMANMWCVTNMF